MHALIVVSHPVNSSLTHSVMTAIAQGINESSPHNTVEIADLTQEGFNPVLLSRISPHFCKLAPRRPM